MSDSTSERMIWIRVGSGVEVLSGLGAAVWNEPAAVRNALRELFSVMPMTHVQIDIDRLRGRSDPPAEWKTILARAGDWAELLRESVAAIGDAVRGRAQWGFGLPNPALVAASLGDASERGVLKAGIQLAGFLQVFREGGLGFVAIDLAGPPVAEKAISQVLRNAQLYGWRPAVMVPSPLSPAPAEIQLVGDGVGRAFWDGAEPAEPLGDLVYGEIPAGIEAAAIVDAGRRLKGVLS